MINVLLVDDHTIIRAGIAKLLEGVNGIRVVEQAASGEQALSFIRKLNPNVVLMDLKMPGMGGMEATKRIVRQSPDSKVLILTGCSDDLYASRLLQAGAVGYLTKHCDIDELLIAIKKVHSGQRYISPEIAHKLALQHVGDKEESPVEQLSERELQIMQMITSGQRVQDISDSLNLSAKTVNSHRYRIFSKLDIQNDVELTLLAIRYGLIEV